MQYASTVHRPPFAVFQYQCKSTSYERSLQTVVSVRSGLVSKDLHLAPFRLSSCSDFPSFFPRCFCALSSKCKADFFDLLLIPLHKLSFWMCTANLLLTAGYTLNSLHMEVVCWAKCFSVILQWTSVLQWSPII